MPILQKKKLRLEASHTAPGSGARVPGTVSSALKCIKRSPYWSLWTSEKQLNVLEMQLMGPGQLRAFIFGSFHFFKKDFLCVVSFTFLNSSMKQVIIFLFHW